MSELKLIEAMEKHYQDSIDPLCVGGNQYSNAMMMVHVRTKKWNRRAELNRLLNNARKKNPQLLKHMDAFLSSYELNRLTSKDICELVVQYDKEWTLKNSSKKRTYKDGSGYARAINRELIKMMEHSVNQIRKKDNFDLMKLRNDLIDHIHESHFIVLNKQIRPDEIYSAVMYEAWKFLIAKIDRYNAVFDAKETMTKIH